MRQLIERFCEDIKVEYSLFLYNYKAPCKLANGKEYLQFPFCCYESADIITSFLQMNFGDEFQYICTTRGNVPHGWTAYEDEKENFVIDFTAFQFQKEFESDIWRKRQKSEEQVIEIIQRYSPVEDKSIFYGFEDVVLPERQECTGRNIKYDVNFTKEGFMIFLNNIIDNVHLNTQYCLYNNFR